MALQSITHPLPVNLLISLAEIRDPHSVSIYLPMDLQGKEQNRHLAQGRLQQCLREVEKALAEFELGEKAIKGLLKPAEFLLDDIEIWRNPRQSLILFLSPGHEMRYYKIPFPLEHQTFVGGHFLLSPLLPLYQDDGQYYLLELSRDYIKLYEGSRFEFRDLHLEKDTPVRLEEAVGGDFKQKNLQYHSGKTTEGAIIHGHGSGKDDKKKELAYFLKMVHEGVLRNVPNREAPLVLSGVDEIASLYRKENAYPCYFEKTLRGDPEFKTLQQRHGESWDLISPYFLENRKHQARHFMELYNTNRVSWSLDEIIPAALDGKVATLFIQIGARVFGSYDSIQKRVHLDKEKTIANTSLTDLAAINTFLQGGKVYFELPDRMPVRNSVMNAIYRF